jgi:hypothetical protein
MKMSPEQPPSRPTKEGLKITFQKAKEKAPVKDESAEESIDIDVSEFGESDKLLELDLKHIEEAPKVSPAEKEANEIAARRKQVADEVTAKQERDAQGFRTVAEFVFHKNPYLAKRFDEDPDRMAIKRYKSGLQSLVHLSAIIYNCDPKDLPTKKDFVEKDLPDFARKFEAAEAALKRGKRSQG